MPRINVLDKHTAELIAAGEVVERPASVIKELVENSIDAGAHTVTVEIKNGGNTFMRVTDDGCGIHPDDIKKAFLRHATSKISTGADLDAISTLGFRGEALASICAVAKVEIMTKTAEHEFGKRYVIHGGEEIEFEDAGCAQGTTIVVRELFYNTPARLKFLKKDTTESNVVASMLERMALSHPEITFRLIRDGKQQLNTPGDGELRSAVFTVCGKAFADSMLPVQYELNGVGVSGYICTPTSSRKSRGMQYFFLNGRYIRTKTGIAAIEQAYKNSIMVGTYPACVLNISLNPYEVDVNVHPSKIEVRFSDESRIFNAVYYAVKSALNEDIKRVAFETKLDRSIDEKVIFKGEQVKLDFKPSAPVKTVPAAPKTPYSHSYIGYEPSPKKQAVSDTEIKNYNELLISTSKSADELKEQISNGAFSSDDVKSVVSPKPQTVAEAQPDEIEFKYIGEAFCNYILVEQDNKIIMIDKHAAHERILFEDIKKNVTHSAQMLLVPVRVELSSEEYDIVLNYIDEINSLGFEIEDFGPKTLLVRGVPMSLENEDTTALVEEIAQKLLNKFTDFTPEFLDWLYHNVACRAAIKAGNKNSAFELEKLARRVLSDKAIRYCPHGRPVAAELTENEIKKRFSRI